MLAFGRAAEEWLQVQRCSQNLGAKFGPGGGTVEHVGGPCASYPLFKEGSKASPINTLDGATAAEAGVAGDGEAEDDETETVDAGAGPDEACPTTDGLGGEEHEGEDGQDAEDAQHTENAEAINAENGEYTMTTERALEAIREQQRCAPPQQEHRPPTATHAPPTTTTASELLSYAKPARCLLAISEFFPLTTQGLAHRAWGDRQPELQPGRRMRCTGTGTGGVAGDPYTGP